MNTIETQQIQTLIQQEESTDEGKREMSAARAEVRTGYLLRKALESSRMSQKALAEQLGVSEGRVSQVFKAQDGMKVVTLARYLRAMGYELVMDGLPTNPSLPPLRTKRKPRSQSKLFAFEHRSSVTHPQTAVIFTDRQDLDGVDITQMSPLGEVHHASAVVAPINASNRAVSVASQSVHVTVTGVTV